VSAGALRPLALVHPPAGTLAALLLRVKTQDTWPFTNRAMPWGLAAFLVMLWLTPFHAIELPISLPLDAKLDRPLLALMAGGWLVSFGLLSARVRPHVRLTPLHGGVALFFVACVASVALNTDLLVNLSEFSLSARKLVLLISFLTFFAIVASVVRPEEVKPFVMLTLALAALTALGTIYEYRFESSLFYSWSSTLLPGLVNVPADLNQIDQTGRFTIYGSMGHPLELALSLNLALPFAIMATVSETDRGKRIRRLLLTGIIVAGVFSTQRKTGLITSGVGVAVLLAYRPRMLRQLIPLAIAMMLMLHVLAPGTMGSLRQQLQPDTVTTVSSTEQRSNDYDAITPDVLTHPAFGRGFGSYDGLKYRILDNQYLGLLVTVGFVGTALYLVMLFTAMGTAHRLARDDRHPGGPVMLAASASVASFIAGGALFDVLSFSHVTYLLCFVLGLIAAGTAPSRRRKFESLHLAQPDPRPHEWAHGRDHLAGAGAERA
jgi:polysaccharide biosynthesis protein PslJ